MIKHLKLVQCDSTQDELKRHGEAYDLVSTVKQTQGRGRGTNIWDSLEGALAFSFRSSVHPQLTWQALEVAVSLAESLENLFGVRIGLKWPNDLYCRDKKCGGILLQHQAPFMLIGVGINLWPQANTPWGSVLETQQPLMADWSHELSKIVTSHYQSTHPRALGQLKHAWSTRCIHLERMVTIKDGEEEVTGIFRGLGEHGEALVGKKAIFNGSLTLQ